MNNRINLKKLETLMSINNLSPVDLSQKIEVNQSTISRILNGVTTKPSYETLRSIAKFFNVRVEDITSNDEQQKDQVNDNERTYNSTHELILFLFNESKLSTAELSNFTGIEYQTLYDIIKGNTQSPNANTLDKIAKFFNLTLSQIRIKEPLPSNYLKSSISTNQKYLPLLNIECIEDWKNGLFKLDDVEKFITTYNMNLGVKSFALSISDDKYKTDFKKGSIIICNYENNYDESDFAVLSLINSSNKYFSLFEICGIKEQETILRECGKMKTFSCRNELIEVFGTVVEIKFK